MGLFGGGSKSATSKTTRPDYIKNMISGLSNDINNTNIGDYTNLQYSGLNANQNAALQSMLSNPEYRGYAEQLMNQGSEGLDSLNNIYKQISDAYGSGEITADSLNNLANQLYSGEDVANAVNAANQQTERDYSTKTAPNAAMQANLSGGFGSSQALSRRMGEEALTQQEQANSESISNDAYQNAMQQAQGILTSNQATRKAALGALSQNAATQAGYMSRGALMADQLNKQGFDAAQQLQQNRQNQLDVDYQNNINKQQWKQQQIQNEINAAATMNAALGQRTTTTTSGGGSGVLGGAMSGAMAGSAFGKIIKIPCAERIINFFNCWKLSLGHKYVLA